MCGRYAMALGRRELRNALEDAGLQIDEDEIDVDRVRQSYNVAPGYYEPIYRAVIDGPQDNADPSAPGEDQEPQDEEATGDPMDESHDNANDAPAKESRKSSGNGKIKYVLSPMKWGLIPFWTKRNPDYPTLMRTINCRDDSLYDNKGMWTSMKNRKRCIVVAQGFFEWLNKGKDKVPHFTKRSDGQLLYFAGLWDCVRYEDSDQDLFTYSIITTSSSKQLTFLHDRMPVIFEPNSPKMKEWLDPTRRWDTGLQKLLQPFENSGLECYPVKKEVGKVGNNSSSFIVPLDSEENKSNIKNFFSKGGKPLQPFKEPAKPWTNPKSLSVKEEEEEEKPLKFEDSVEETQEDDYAEGMETEDVASLPLLPSPSKSPTKSNPTTPLHPPPKRKLSEIDEPELTQSSPTNTPSPVKREQKFYSSTDTTKNPKKGVPTPKKAKKGLDAKQMGNKSITSFFSKT